MRGAIRRVIELFCCTVAISGLAQDERLTFDRDPDQALHLPRFREATDALVRSEGQYVNSSGLDKLRVSGSGQFSELGFTGLLGQLAPKARPSQLVILDVRSEDHGFLNGLPIGWRPLLLSQNVPARPAALLIATEQRRLRRLGKLPVVEVFLPPQALIWVGSVQVPVQNTAAELDLVSQRNTHYARIALEKDAVPADYTVDAIVELAKSLSSASWLHVHDQMGTGRTTLVMIMLDMIANARLASASDIISRQFLLGGVNLASIPFNPQLDPLPWDRFYPPSAIVPAYRDDQVLTGFNPIFQNNPRNPFFEPMDPMQIGLLLPGNQWGSPEKAEARLRFLNDFYAYCKQGIADGYSISWSQWKDQGIVFEQMTSREAAQRFNGQR